MAYEESSESGHDEPWIQWFCGLKGHNFFCEVEKSYIEDGFNLYGLRACVSNFSDSLDLILDLVGPNDSDDSNLTHSACTLYCLIHARYVVTSHGLDAMYNKYATKEFGFCPLVQCDRQPVLPVGITDEIGVDTVKLFCPKCQCIYHPLPLKSRNSHQSTLNNIGNGLVDGAAFGTTFPHLFLMTFGNLMPEKLPPGSKYIPRVFGFRVHQSSHCSANDYISKLSTNNSSLTGNIKRESVTVKKSHSQLVDNLRENGMGHNRTLTTGENGYIDLNPEGNNTDEGKLISKSFSKLSELQFNENLCLKQLEFVEKCKNVNNNERNTFDQKVNIGTSTNRDRDVNGNVLQIKPKRQKRSSNLVT